MNKQAGKCDPLQLTRRFVRCWWSHDIDAMSLADMLAENFTWFGQGGMAGLCNKEELLSFYADRQKHDPVMRVVDDRLTAHEVERGLTVVSGLVVLESSEGDERAALVTCHMTVLVASVNGRCSLVHIHASR